MADFVVEFQKPTQHCKKNVLNLNLKTEKKNGKAAKWI